MIKVRFAPSPTGTLHIGSARTALFNWLYARHSNGKFYLRIEDTDKERSTDENVDKILDGLRWLGLDWDDEIVFQSKRAARHSEVAHELLKLGKAYRCYCSKEELDSARQEAVEKGMPTKYAGTCRDKEHVEGKPYAIRFKTPNEGSLILNDKVQGKVEVQNQNIEDFVLLRQDLSPIYLLSVVVDDHDMEITHIIRGDDHLTNTFKQMLIYKAMGWEEPIFGHIPLIHGQSGSKLSKREGAVGLEEYREMGFLPEALFNYLLRLGWSHGDDEIISRKQAIEWFNLEALGKSSARFNFEKLQNINATYIKNENNEALLKMLFNKYQTTLDVLIEKRLLRGMNGLKQRSKTLNELWDNSKFYREPLEEYSNEAKDYIIDQPVLKALTQYIQELPDLFTEENLQEFTKNFVKAHGIKLVQLAQPLRIALSGHLISPSIFEIMEIFDKNETVTRIQKFLNWLEKKSA